MFEFMKKFFVKKNNPQDTPSDDKEVLIHIGEEYEFRYLDLLEDCTLKDFMFTVDKYGYGDILNDICNSALIDGSINNLRSKKIYVLQKDNILYNFYMNNDMLLIDERIFLENGHIEERTLTIHRDKKFKISRMMHNSELSTYDISFYPSSPTIGEFFKMEYRNALKILREMLKKINSIDNISLVIDLSLIESIYLELLSLDGDATPIIETDRLLKKESVKPGDKYE